MKAELDKEDSTKSATVEKQSDSKSIKVTYKGYETTINIETGSMTALAKTGETSLTPTPTTPSSSTLPSGTYTVGQEVTFGGEHFFVISDDDSSVKLLAKYCLNRIGTSQETSHEPSFSKFSNTCYWFDWDDEERADYGSLQSDEMITLAEEDGDVSEGIPNAVLMAMNYGSSKGVIGRLLTVDEVDNFCSSDISDEAWGLFCGHWDEDYAYGSSCMLFWVGDYYEDRVIYADGSVDGYWDYSDGWSVDNNVIGVRPVLIVQKSHS